MRSKQAVRHSIVRRRESLQHKPTLHGQHKTWLLVPFYYHKTGGGKNKIWICECVVKSSKKWVISFSQKQVLITLYKPEKLYDIRLGSLLLALFKNTSTRGRFAIPMSLRTQCMQKERRTTNVSCRHEITPHTVQSIDKLQIN